MKITIKIITPAINTIDDPSSIIGAIVGATIPGGISISGEITEIITDDGTIIDRESIIISASGIAGGANKISGSTTREGNAPRGSLIQAGTA